MFCISIPVHEQPEVIRNQLTNMRAFLQNPHIILHLSFGSLHIKKALEEIVAEFDNVHLNPTHYPTEWGWILHAHLFNFKYAESLGLDFDYFVLHSSHDMYVKPGAEAYASQFDYLSSAQHIDHLGLTPDPMARWVADVARNHDKPLNAMCEALGIKDLYLTLHEGSAYRRDLFREMLTALDRHAPFEFNEYHYPKEELYLSTLAAHFSKNSGLPLVFARYRAPLNAMLSPEELVDTLRAAGPASPAFPDSPDFLSEFWKSGYALHVARNMKDPTRQYLTNILGGEIACH